MRQSAETHPRHLDAAQILIMPRPGSQSIRLPDVFQEEQAAGQEAELPARSKVQAAEKACESQLGLMMR